MTDDHHRDLFLLREARNHVDHGVHLCRVSDVAFHVGDEGRLQAVNDEEGRLGAAPPVSQDILEEILHVDAHGIARETDVDVLDSKSLGVGEESILGHLGRSEERFATILGEAVAGLEEHRTLAATARGAQQDGRAKNESATEDFV